MPEKSTDGLDTYFSPRERLLALAAAPILFGLAVLIRWGFGGTAVGDGLVWLVGFGAFPCAWIAVVGGWSSD